MKPKYLLPDLDEDTLKELRAIDPVLDTPEGRVAFLDMRQLVVDSLRELWRRGVFNHPGVPKYVKPDEQDA